MSKRVAVVLISLSLLLIGNTCFAKKKERTAAEILNEIPKPEFYFEKYNFFAGNNELDISAVKSKKSVVSEGIISPDYSKMVYSEVLFLPQNSQISSRIFYIDLYNYQGSNIDRASQADVRDKVKTSLIETGMTDFNQDLFRVLTIIDWSSDGTKLLVKEKAGENQRAIWQTDAWVYDFNTSKATKYPEIREAIKLFWGKSYNLELGKYRWDIKPLGWNKNNHNEFIVAAYGYNYRYKKFLGLWGLNLQDKKVRLLSLMNEKTNISANGYITKLKH